MGPYVGVTLEELGHRPSESPGPLAVDYAHPAQAGQDGVVQPLIELRQGLLDPPADDM